MAIMIHLLVIHDLIVISEIYKRLSIMWAEKYKKLKKWFCYSVLNEEPHEHDFVTLGLLILNPEPIRLSM